MLTAALLTFFLTHKVLRRNKRSLPRFCQRGHLWVEGAPWMALGLPVAFALWGNSLGPGSCATLRRCLNYVLEELKNNARAEVMVASHNEDTVRFTLRR